MLNQSIIDRSAHVDPAQIGHYVESGYMHPRIKPIDEQMRVIGPAITVRMPTYDNSVLYYAMRHAEKGSVVVIDRMGEGRFACVGEMVVRAARACGLAGIIVDGPSTDTLAIKKLDFPVFSTGRSAVTNILCGMDGEYGVEVTCGGAVVHPGDIVFGDCDGVIVCPPDQFEGFLKKAELSNEREKLFIEAFDNGGYISDFIDIDQLVSTDMKAEIRMKAKKK